MLIDSSQASIDKGLKFAGGFRYDVLLPDDKV